MVSIKSLLILLLIMFCSQVCLGQEDPLTSIGKSHIDANVPDEKEFDNFLRRDMTAYVTDSSDKGISVTVELLRDGPTQTGVALPKYYCWIVKRDAKGVVMEEAAARIAAIEKKRFEVIQYFTKERIIAEPDLMKGVFPSDVYNKLLTKIKPSEK